MMALNKETPTYLFCSGCSMKYINDEEHIKQDFGYNRLNIRYKSCIQCQARYLKYRESHKEERRDYSLIYYQDNKDIISENGRIYRDNNKDKEKEKTKCNVCGSIVSHHGMVRHLRTNKCQKFQLQ